MKPNPILPILAKIAPPLFLVALAGFAIKEIFSATDKKPENELKPKTPEPQKPIFHSVNLGKYPAQNTDIPPNSGGKINSDILLSPNFPANSGQNKPETAIPPNQNVFSTEIPAKKQKSITREHMEMVFNHGKCGMSRKDAITFLKKLGFGKSAAYDALSANGRFSFWLHCGADGTFTWNKETI